MYNRVYLGIVMAISLFASGCYLGYRYASSEIVSTASHKKMVQIVNEVRPDGTVITTETETLQEDASKTPAPTSSGVSPKETNYSIGIKANILNPKEVEAEIARRAFWDLWGTVSWDSKDNTVRAGLRFDF